MQRSSLRSQIVVVDVDLELIPLGHTGDRVATHVAESEAELDIVVETVTFKCMNCHACRGGFAIPIGYGVGERLRTTKVASGGVSQAQTTRTNRKRSAFIRASKACDNQRSAGTFNVIEKYVQRVRDRICWKIE